MTAKVTSPELTPAMVNTGEFPGTWSPLTTVYVVPLTFTRADSAGELVEVGLGVGVGEVVANGMNGSLAVNLSSNGSCRAGSATAMVPAPSVSPRTALCACDWATDAPEPAAGASLRARARASARVEPTRRAMAMYVSVRRLAIIAHLRRAWPRSAHR